MLGFTEEALRVFLIAETRVAFRKIFSDRVALRTVMIVHLFNLTERLVEKAVNFIVAGAHYQRILAINR